MSNLSIKFTNMASTWHLTFEPTAPNKWDAFLTSSSSMEEENRENEKCGTISGPGRVFEAISLCDVSQAEIFEANGWKEWEEALLRAKFVEGSTLHVDLEKLTEENLRRLYESEIGLDSQELFDWLDKVNTDPNAALDELPELTYDALAEAFGRLNPEGN